MKRLQQNALLVGLVALALGACSSTRSDMASQSTSPPPMASEPAAPATASSQPADASTQPAASSMAGGTSMPGTTPGATAGVSMPDQTGYTPSPATAAANSIVTLIEVLPRQQANMPGSDTSGSSTSGSGAGGSTAAGGSDKVYRVTLHMDDGSTRVITQEVMPTFRAGDRVRLENGMVLR
jgi:hypothetical protein